MAEIILPDKYNTGIRATPTMKPPATGWDTNKTWMTKDSLSIQTRVTGGAKYLQFNTTNMADGSSITLENINFLDVTGGGTVSYLYISSNHAKYNDYRTKDITIVLKNCIVPAIRAVYDGTVDPQEYKLDASGNIQYDNTTSKKPLMRSIIPNNRPYERIKWRLENCTCYGLIAAANLYADHCQFVSTGSDCIRSVNTLELRNCYGYNRADAYPTSDGDHVDILQATPARDRSPAQEKYFKISNCNLFEPITNKFVKQLYNKNTGKWYANAVSGCMMLDLDYANVGTVTIDGLYCNGAAYSLYFSGGYEQKIDGTTENGSLKVYTSNKLTLNGSVKNVEYGFGQWWGNGSGIYDTAEFNNLTGMDNVTRPSHPYIGSVYRKASGSNTVCVCVTNYTSSEANLTYKTATASGSESSAKAIETIEAYPSAAYSNGLSAAEISARYDGNPNADVNGALKAITAQYKNSGGHDYNSINDFPVNVLKEITVGSNDTLLKIYDGETLLRTIDLTSLTDAPTTGSDDSGNEGNEGTGGENGSDTPAESDRPDTWAISDVLLTGLADAFRDVGAEGKFTLKQMADMVRQFGSSGGGSSVSSDILETTVILPDSAYTMEAAFANLPSSWKFCAVIPIGNQTGNSANVSFAGFFGDFTGSACGWQVFARIASGTIGAGAQPFSTQPRVSANGNTLSLTAFSTSAPWAAGTYKVILIGG